MASNSNSYALSSTRFAHHFPAYVHVKSEMDYASQNRCAHGHDQVYQSSPHGLSSCMYAASVASPCIPSSSPVDNCVTILSAIKENTGFRSVPSCRRRLDFNHNACNNLARVGPVAVAKRNERERNRVKLINMTFQTLRQHLPLSSSSNSSSNSGGGGGAKGKARKLSKVQTLRSAIDYIRQLQDLVRSRYQLHHQLEEYPRQADERISKTFTNSESENRFPEKGSVIRSPLKRESPGGFFLCQTPYPSLASFGCVEDASKAAMLSGKLEAEPVSSSCTVYSRAESPYSQASSYDAALTTPDDQEFIDFDDWF